jgi:excinuclease UvrABC nuclease subunit
MTIDKLSPKIESTFEFEFSNLKKVPIVFGCYVISNFNNEIMYIGKATNLKNRFTNHLDTPEKNIKTKIGKSYWFSYRICKNEFEISKLERGWLNEYQLKKGDLPIFNKIHA